MVKRTRGGTHLVALCRSFQLDLDHNRIDVLHTGVLSQQLRAGRWEPLSFLGFLHGPHALKVLNSLFGGTEVLLLAVISDDHLTIGVNKVSPEHGGLIM